MIWASRIVGIGGLLLAAAVPGPAESGHSETVIRVRIYDYAGVAPATLERAKADASQILARAGVRLHWVDCRLRQEDPAKDSACEGAVTRMDLQLRVLDKTMAMRAGTSRHCLGYALLTGGPSIAAVYFHRALDLEKQNLADRPAILGGMMAHEIGHLILAESRHSVNGIMRAAWGGEELKQLARGRMWFTPEQTRRMGATVAKRVQESGEGEESAGARNEDSPASSGSTSQLRKR